MEESKIENSSADTELAVVEKDNSDDKNVSNGDAEVIEKDPDIRKDDTYRIYDYLKANPVLTVAILSAVAALITFLLNLVVFIVGWRAQKVQGLSFYFRSNSDQWYYMALISLLMTIIVSCYSFLAADAGEVNGYNNIANRYAIEYSRYLKTRVKKQRAVLITVKKELRKERRQEKKLHIEQESKFRSDTETILKKEYDETKNNIKEINDIQSLIAKQRISIALTPLSETILMFFLYGGVTLLYFNLVTNKVIFAIIPTLAMMMLNVLLLTLYYSFSAKKERVPKCTEDNKEDFRNKMLGYMRRKQRKNFAKRLKEKGFRAFFPDRIVFYSVRMILSRLTITCIIVAVTMAVLPKVASEFRITEYDNKTYIVVAKNENSYALIEVIIVDENTLKVHRESERYITTDDLLIVTRSFKNVEWLNADKQE